MKSCLYKSYVLDVVESKSKKPRLRPGEEVKTRSCSARVFPAEINENILQYITSYNPQTGNLKSEKAIVLVIIVKIFIFSPLSFQLHRVQLNRQNFHIGTFGKMKKIIFKMTKFDIIFYFVWLCCFKLNAKCT